MLFRSMFSSYEAFALLAALIVLEHGIPQAKVVSILQRVRSDLYQGALPSRSGTLPDEDANLLSPPDQAAKLLTPPRLNRLAKRSI